MKVAEGTFDLEALPANGFPMGPARDERHVTAGRGHTRAEITSDGTRSHDREPHRAPSADLGFASLNARLLEDRDACDSGKPYRRRAHAQRRPDMLVSSYWSAEANESANVGQNGQSRNDCRELAGPLRKGARHAAAR